MVRSLSLLTVLLFTIGATVVDAWITNPPLNPCQYRISPSCLAAADKESSTAGDIDDSQCTWQDIWNYDCAMSTVYSASFVAQDWIKSMPCAVGLSDDCETPEELKLPGPSVGSGVEEVDVMGFLNLKRAAPLKKSDDSLEP